MAVAISSKICTACNCKKTIDQFGKQSAYRDGYRNQCNPCRSKAAGKKARTEESRAARRQWYRKSRQRNLELPNKDDVFRWPRIKQKYGLSKDGYEALLSKQGGRCGICMTDNPGGRYGVFVVDHCHASQEVRGLLCSSCNTAIGKLGDTVEALERAVNYLKGGA